MSGLWKGAQLGILLVAIFVIGLQHFIHQVQRLNDSTPITNTLSVSPAHQTGIVVATGGDKRVSTGLHLLAARLGQRLLISGIGAGVSKADIFGLVPFGAIAPTRLNEMLACCVDLGAAAENTRGNALEAKAWAQQHGYAYLVLVTADYHMPRSLNDFRARISNANIIPHAVPSGARLKYWWRSPAITAMLGREYLKYLLSRLI